MSNHGPASLTNASPQHDSPNHDHGPFVSFTNTSTYSDTDQMILDRYAISSLISLFSLNAAFAIDAIRDIYEVSFAGPATYILLTPVSRRSLYTISSPSLSPIWAGREAS